MLSRAVITVAALTTLVCGGTVGSRASTGRFAILADEVVKAIQAQGLQIEPQQISFLASVTASESAPRLHVVDARRIEASQTAVRLACESNAICLPFYVVLRGSGEEQNRLLSLPAARNRVKGRGQPAAKPCIRTGDRASLVMEKQDMRITVQVIALQNGRIGETIRVTDTDRKRLYRAEVSGPGLVKGAL